MCAERVKTKGLIGGDVATLTVAFGKRMPPYNAALHEKTPEKSVLERELNVEAEAVKDKLRHEAYMKEREMFLRDPHPAPSTQGKGLPPNAGTARAVEMWQTQADATRSGHAPDNSYLSTSMPAGSAGSTSSGVPGQQAASSSGRGAVHGLGSSQLGSRACGGTPNAGEGLLHRWHCMGMAASTGQ